MHVCIIASLTRNQSKFDRCLSQPLVLTLNVSQEVEGQTEPESHGQHQRLMPHAQASLLKRDLRA